MPTDNACSSNPSIRIPSQPFEPPIGFEKYNFEQSNMSATSDTFSNLGQKQIWHISAPANLNIGSIKQLDVEAALKGEPILSVNGIDYSMQPASDRKEKILLPDETTGKYRAFKSKIEQSFRLLETNATACILLGDDHGSSARGTEDALSTYTAQSAGQQRPPRQQPSGLKMRYMPFGVYDSPSKPDSLEKGTERQLSPSSLPGRSSLARTKKSKQKAKPDELTTAEDTMDIDEELRAGDNGQRSHRQSTHSSSPVKDSTTAKKEKKKKKKRSRLVDDTRL